ncbi:peptidoglycan/xylan/chitin deacetylase (PgdA/CDA1 family) [Micromonospora polyrhachis]|uniref:Peptidoglycan/xylan/chitin deacetylase (PgdA/CDA1 family) n=1 Tax=Micromonospora polyrhachis TaxID=1282883 RepID=A0A7W7SNB7_9ACTN|nr:peptidoglycan/xylan/chitin deacetylase (PgdA/CDA1 family) [Micromonospora polyrhachis]
MIHGLRAQGFEFVTVSELLAEADPGQGREHPSAVAPQ